MLPLTMETNIHGENGPMTAPMERVGNRILTIRWHRASWVPETQEISRTV